MADDWLVNAIAREGAKAFHNGKHYEMCPYTMGTFRNLWLQGYREASRATGRR